MNAETRMVYDFEKKLINYVKKCLSNTKHFKNISNNLDIDFVKNNIRKIQSETSVNASRKTIYELIIESITYLLDRDIFTYQKSFSQFCDNCQQYNAKFYEMRYVKVNLDKYSGDIFDLNEFFETIESEWRCIKCKSKKNIDSRFTFNSLPEILIIILGAKEKGDEKIFQYKYKEKLKFMDKKNKYQGVMYTLKALIGQIKEYEFNSFIFKSESSFNNELSRNKKIFEYPTILFYEREKIYLNIEQEDDEYLDPNAVHEMPEKSNRPKKIMVYFKFRKAGEEIYLEIGNNEKFKKAIIELKEKYAWLKTIKNMEFKFHNKLIDDDKTMEENGLEDCDYIDIV